MNTPLHWNSIPLPSIFSILYGSDRFVFIAYCSKQHAFHVSIALRALSLSLLLRFEMRKSGKGGGGGRRVVERVGGDRPKKMLLKRRCSWSIAARSIFYSRSTHTNLSLIKEYFTFCVSCLFLVVLCHDAFTQSNKPMQGKKRYVLGARPHFSNAIS